MEQKKKVIENLYTAFQNLDYQSMADCYHPDASFRDEAFNLKATQVPAMWKMLCERAKDFSLTFTVQEKNGVITAHWEPKYTFSQTNRSVHNIIDAEFDFKEGKIIRHIDTFNFWHWSRQSLGLPGLLLGWSPLLKNKVQTQAMKSLELFMAAS